MREIFLTEVLFISIGVCVKEWKWGSDAMYLTNHLMKCAP